MITLYKPTETDFTHNGEAVLDNITISAVILHKLNGEYSLEIELLKDDRGKYKLLRQHSIIKACGQLFRLYSQENIQDTEVKVKALLYHITYDINLDVIDDYRAVDCKADQALSKVVLDKRFTIVETDIETINTAYFVDELPFDGIHKKILERWGGELLQDNFNIGIKRTIGIESPIAVTFKKNIKGFTETRDYKGVYTRIKPKGKDGITIKDVNNGSDWLVSPRSGDYFKILSTVITFEDIESPLELKNKVLNELWGKVDIPVVSFKVDFIDLSNTVEYKRFSNLKGLNTGDTIKVYHEYFNVDLVAKVQETKRNAITGEVESLVLGDLIQDFIEGVQSTVEDYVEKKGNSVLKQTKDMISLEVSEVKSEIETLYDELDGSITNTNEAVVQLESKLSVTANEIRGEVSKLKTYADGKIEETNSLVSQTANEIRGEVSENITELDGKISSNKSLISQTASQIRAEIAGEVKTLDGKISSANSKITQNTNSISTNVTETNKIKDKVTGLESTVSTHTTQINQTADKVEIVAQKQEDGILEGKTYSFDGEGFTIGDSSGSTTAFHNNEKSVWRHSGGTYSEANHSGFYRDGRPYHSLVSIGKAIAGGSAGTYPQIVTIRLPDYWRGKNFSVTVSMVDTTGGYVEEYMARTHLSVVEVNQAEAYFKVKGYWIAMWGKLTNEKELTFSYIAIGG